MLARALRFLAAIGVVAAAAWLASLHSREAAFLTLGALLVAALVVLSWLPRAAHRAFQGGRFVRAAWLYRVLRWVRIGRDARASVRVSLAACALGREHHDRALAILDRVEVDRLGDAVRAAWLNNRAYALSRAGRTPREALEHSDQAIALRPDVAGFRHTRGIALLGLGRTDEAIHELDSLWSRLSADNDKPLLEAERCYDLGLAWRAKGEEAYATDYFDRARRAAPESVWASRAGAYLDQGHKLAELASLLEVG